MSQVFPGSQEVQDTNAIFIGKMMAVRARKLHVN